MSSLIKDYTNFDVNLYLSPRYSKPKRTWCFKQLYTFWQKFESKKNIKLLEFGGGPNISRLVSACPYVTDIVFSEYAEHLRNAVEDWISNKGFDWKPTFDFIVKDIEGKDDQASSLRQEEVKSKIKAVIPCDINTASEALDTSSLPANLLPPYDVVFTSYCLEAVVESNEQYKESLNKLSKLVKPGGFLVIHGGLEAKFYRVGENKYYVFPLYKEVIVESHEEAGLIDVIYEEFIFGDEKISSRDTKGEFLIYGKKK